MDDFKTKNFDIAFTVRKSLERKCNLLFEHS